MQTPSLMKARGSGRDGFRSGHIAGWPVKAFLRCLFIGFGVRSASAQTVWTLRTAPAVDGVPLRPAGKPGVYLIPIDSHTPTYDAQYFLRSTDGIQWTRITLPDTSLLFCFNGRFFGLGQYGVWISDDGISYQQAIQGDGNFLPVGMAYGNGTLLIALGDGRIARSITNGDSWDLRTSPASQLYGITFGGGKFLAYSSGSLSSSDGVSWTVGAASPPNAFWGICYIGGRFVTLTHTSSNGTTWTAIPETGWAPGENYLRCGGGNLLMWDYAGAYLKQSATGVWQGPYAMPVLDHRQDVEYCGGIWIAVTSGGKVLTSGPPVAPALTVSPGLRLSWQSDEGRSYTVQRSGSMNSWTDATSAMAGTGGVMQWSAGMSGPKQFFRIKVQ